MEKRLLQGILHFSVEIFFLFNKSYQSHMYPNLFTTKRTKSTQNKQKRRQNEAKRGSFFVVWRGKLKERTHIKLMRCSLGWLRPTVDQPIVRVGWRLTRKIFFGKKETTAVNGEWCGCARIGHRTCGLAARRRRCRASQLRSYER